MTASIQPSVRRPSRILPFLGLSAALGVLVAAAAVPGVALIGITTSSAISLFEGLPSYLQVDQLAQKTNIWETNNGQPTLLASFFVDNRVDVTWDQVSQWVKDAAVAGEDPRFYTHGAVDMRGTIRGAVSTLFGQQTQGGSTITQQYVKNVLINNGTDAARTDAEKAAAYRAATAPTLGRKIKELRYAVALEKKYTKDQILLGYLNISPFGGQVYGIEAAAQYYYGVSSKDLSIAQAASLLAMVNAPDLQRIDRPDSATNGANTQVNGKTVPYAVNKVRRDYILDKMSELKMITPAQHDEAVNTPVQPKITQPNTGCQSSPDAAYFCQYVTSQIINQFDDPKTTDVNEGLQLLNKGGLNVYTTLDPDLQAGSNAAIAAIPKSVPNIDLGAVTVTVQPGTGRVLAMTQNKNYSQDQSVLAADSTYSAVNYNTDSNQGGSSGFQPGSTYKLFTLLEWLKEGHALNETVDAHRRSNWGVFQDSCLGPQDPGSWNPQNANGSNGGIWSALTNTIMSYNTGYIAMAKKIDLCQIRKTAEALGVHRADGQPLAEGPASVIGTNEIAPVVMAGAFATIGAGGLYCPVTGIDKIVAGDGSDITKKQPCVQAIDPGVAAAVQYALALTLHQFTPFMLNYMSTGGLPMFTKTGTSDNAEANWVDGGTTKAVTVSGVFNVSGHVSLLSGPANWKYKLWALAQDAANKKYGSDPFPAPAAQYLNPVKTTVPSVLGLSPSDAQAALTAAGFASSVDGTVASAYPQGTIGAQDPPPGLADKGTTVRLQTSTGGQSTVPNVVGMSESAARTALVNASFNVTVTDVIVSDAGSIGKVVSTDPAVGTPASIGTPVTIYVGAKAGQGAPGHT